MVPRSSYLAPEDQQFLFVPVSKETAASSIASGQLDASQLERATFDYDVAKSRLAELTHSDPLEVSIPLIMVFQNQYDREIPTGDVSLDSHVAFLYHPVEGIDELMVSRVLEQSLTEVLPIVSAEVQMRLALYFKRIAARPSSEWTESFQFKLQEYNEVVEECSGYFDKVVAVNADGILPPDSTRFIGTPDASVFETQFGIGNIQESLGQRVSGYVLMPHMFGLLVDRLSKLHFGEDASFEDRFAYVKEHHPELWEDDAQMDTQFRISLDLAAEDLRNAQRSMEGIMYSTGLTAKEFNVYLSILRVRPPIDRMKGALELYDMQQGKRFATKDRVWWALEQFDPDFSPIVQPSRKE